MQKPSSLRFRVSLLAFLCLLAAVLLLFPLWAGGSAPALPEYAATLSRVGSTGNEVRAIQQELKDRGLYAGEIDGVYGSATEAAVRRFQTQQGLAADGIAGPATLKKLGISVGAIPSATEENVYLLARIISAEARGEPYSGQVAGAGCGWGGSAQPGGAPLLPGHHLRCDLSGGRFHRHCGRSVRSAHCRFRL